MGRAINEFKVLTKYLKDDLFLTKIENPRILSVHGQVHHLQTTKVRAHEFK